MVAQMVIFSVIMSPVKTINPFNTELGPSMEIFDDDHVLIDYQQSFVIQNFTNIKAISVFLANSTRSIAVATTEDITRASNGLKIFQKLEKKSKLKGKLNPCKRTQFFVRLRLYDGDGYLDSVVGTYNPDQEMAVVSLYHNIYHNINYYQGLDILHHMPA